MAKRSKTPARPNSVQDRDALINAIARKGELDRQRADLCAVAEAKVTEIHQNLSLALTEIDKEIAQLEADVHGFAEANKATLLPPGLKTLKLPVGDLGWRTNPASVSVIGGNEVAVPKLKAAGLSQFVRTVEEVNKDAILATRTAYLKGKDGEPESAKLSGIWADLTLCKAVKINADKEVFWFTPTIVEPAADALVAV